MAAPIEVFNEHVGHLTKETFTVEPTSEKCDVAKPPRGLASRLCNKEYWRDMAVGCTAEVIGTAIYLYIAVMSNQNNDPLTIAFAAGATISMLIIAMANISGAHFNPAVSLGFFFVGDISFIRLILYIVSQAGGSVLGAYLARFVLSTGTVYVENVGNVTQYESFNGGAHFLHGGITPPLAIVAETTYCFSMMVVCFLAAVDSKTRSPLAPIAVAFVIISCILAGFNNTSGSFNPARSFGAAVAVSYYRPDVWEHHYVYWVGPMLGSALAAYIYRILFSDSEHSIRCRIIKLI